MSQKANMLFLASILSVLPSRHLVPLCLQEVLNQLQLKYPFFVSWASSVPFLPHLFLNNKCFCALLPQANHPSIASSSAFSPSLSVDSQASGTPVIMCRSPTGKSMFLHRHTLSIHNVRWQTLPWACSSFSFHFLLPYSADVKSKTSPRSNLKFRFDKMSQSSTTVSMHGQLFFNLKINIVRLVSYYAVIVKMTRYITECPSYYLCNVMTQVNWCWVIGPDRKKHSVCEYSLLTVHFPLFQSE